jgi:hypothetical protein
MALNIEINIPLPGGRYLTIGGSNSGERATPSVMLREKQRSRFARLGGLRGEQARRFQRKRQHMWSQHRWS